MSDKALTLKDIIENIETIIKQIDCDCVVCLQNKSDLIGIKKDIEKASEF
jgi:hypothetical protein